MAPEQARGKPVDQRADVCAFGVILCEMITSRQLFEGETASDVIAGVLTNDSDLGPLPPLVRYVVERFLSKDSRKRWQAIGDARMALDGGLLDAPILPTARHTRWPWVIAAVSLLVALVAFIQAVHGTKFDDHISRSFVDAPRRRSRCGRRWSGPAPFRRAI